MIPLTLSLIANLLTLNGSQKPPLPTIPITDIAESKEQNIKTDIPNELSHNILCVEVGWQRIKAAVLPEDINYDKLKTIQTISAPSGNWLNVNFPLLFKISIPNPLSPLLKVPHDKASLSISGPVVDHRYHPDLGKRGIPVDLKKACEALAKCDVLVENDVICWAIGCQELLKLQAKPPKFPFLALTFGTGLGSALALNEETIYNIELTYLNCPFSRLKFLTREQPFNPKFTPHRALGKPFFDWKLGRKEFSDQEVAPYLFNYNNRFQAFIEDFVEALNELFSLKIQDILIGGGYSRFLEIPENYNHSIILMKPQILKAEGISPDIIQLLGCLRLSQKNPPKTILYPEYEDIQIIRKNRQKNALRKYAEEDI
jgi:hypothetical protein